jgi:hypothetical protein
VGLRPRVAVVLNVSEYSAPLRSDANPRSTGRSLDAWRCEDHATGCAAARPGEWVATPTHTGALTLSAPAKHIVNSISNRIMRRLGVALQWSRFRVG